MPITGETVNGDTLARVQMRLAKAEKELDMMQRARAMTQDKRLRFFGPNASGSNSRNNKSDSPSETADKAAKKSRLDAAEVEVRIAFAPVLTCFICGTTTSVSIAHIVTTGEADYSAFGVAAGYVCDLDVFSIRNFVPLCGSYGQRGTCHDAFDRYLVNIMYNPLEKFYFLLCAEDAPERLKSLAEDPYYKLVRPESWTPYHRLLSWRAQQSAICHRYTAAFEQLGRMSYLSEVAASLGSVDASEY